MQFHIKITFQDWR